MLSDEHEISTLVLFGLSAVVPTAPMSSVANSPFPSVDHDHGDLSKRLDSVLVIDVRSNYEFDTLHILKWHQCTVDQRWGVCVLQLFSWKGRPGH